MEETKIQELALDDSPVVVDRAGQLPKGFRLAKPANFTSISENEYEIYPSGGDIDYTADKHILYDIGVSNERMKFIYGPATYHSFLITITTQAAILDSTSNCVFREMRLNGASLLESCDNVNVLNNILLDCTVNPLDRVNYYSFMGAKPSFGTIAAASDVTNFSTFRDGLTLAAAASAYLIQIIPSGLIGAFQTKLFPISECKKNLKLDFKLESNALALQQVVDGAVYTLSNCRMKLCLIELNDMLTDAVRRIYDSIYIIPYDSWTQYPFTITVGGTGGTINISTSLKNLKGIVACFRHGTIVSASTGKSLSTRSKIRMIEYRWSVNGKSYPSDTSVYLSDEAELVGAGTGGADDARGFIQVMKLFNNVPSTHATCSFSLREFNSRAIIARVGDGAAENTGRGAFLAAVNLELPNAEDEYRTTTDSTSNNIRFIYKLETQITANNVYVDFYLWYGGEAVIENGVVTANF